MSLISGQLASFLVTNASLREENVFLQNVAIAIPRPDDATTTHHLDILTAPYSPTRSESTDNFSPPPRYTRQQRRSDYLTYEKCGPRVTHFRQHVVLPIRSCNPKSGSPITTLHITENPNVQRSLGPFRPSNALSTNHDALD